jgi:hypothetical protein
MTFEELLAALHAWLNRPVHVTVNGPGALLAKLEGPLHSAYDLARPGEDIAGAGVFCEVGHTYSGFLLDPAVFVAAREMYDGKLIEVEQRGDVLFLIELRD